MKIRKTTTSITNLQVLQGFQICEDKGRMSNYKWMLFGIWAMWFLLNGFMHKKWTLLQKWKSLFHKWVSRELERLLFKISGGGIISGRADTSFGFTYLGQRESDQTQVYLIPPPSIPQVTELYSGMVWQMLIIVIFGLRESQFRHQFTRAIET